MCACECVCVQDMRWQGCRTASLRRASQRQTKQDCSYWAGVEKKMSESGRAETKAQWLTDQQWGSSDLNWTHLIWAVPQTRHTARLRAGRGYKVSAHIWAGGLIAALWCWYVGCICFQTQPWKVQFQVDLQPKALRNFKCQGTCMRRNTL